MLYEKLHDNLVRCKVCPHRCFVKPRARGICRIRENREGKLQTLVYGETSAMAVDPIEKKPFFNFWPGSLSFSISTVGCNFKCPWCQNWNISQCVPEDSYLEYVAPEKVVELAINKGCRTIAYTYNEPVIWFEYVYDTAKLAREKGVLNVLVTNGYITAEALDMLAPLVDAANVDIKSFNKDFYTKYCGANLQAVLDATASMKERGIHVETTLLIIPELNDSSEELAEFCRWQLKHLGPDTPMHFSRFHPNYKFTDKPPTPSATIRRAREIALSEGVHYVYAGNLPGDLGENTYCPNCRKLLVKRYGFSIAEWNLMKEKKCPSCGFNIAIKGEYEPGRSIFLRDIS